jgi:hypothetical protein
MLENMQRKINISLHLEQVEEDVEDVEDVEWRRTQKLITINFIAFGAGREQAGSRQEGAGRWRRTILSVSFLLHVTQSVPEQNTETFNIHFAILNLLLFIFFFDILFIICLFIL